MLIHALAHPQGHGDDYWHGGLRRSEMHRAAAALLGKPVIVGHPRPDETDAEGTRAVGVVKKALVTSDGELRVVLEVDDDEAAEGVRRGDLRHVSYGWDAVYDESSGEARLTQLKAKHMALVGEPGIDGADMLAIVDGDRGYIKASLARHKADMDTIVREEPKQVTLEQVLDAIRGLVGAPAGATAEDTLAAAQAKAKAQADDEAKRVADAKAAEEKRISELVAKYQTDEVLQTELARAKETGLMNDPESVLNTLTENAAGVQFLEVFASTAAGYGNIQALNKKLEARNKELEALHQANAKSPATEALYAKKATPFAGVLKPASTSTSTTTTTVPVHASAEPAAAAPKSRKLHAANLELVNLNPSKRAKV